MRFHSSEVSFHSSEVSFHSSEVLFRPSVENFHLLRGDFRIPREESARETTAPSGSSASSGARSLRETFATVSSSESIALGSES